MQPAPPLMLIAAMHGSLTLQQLHCESDSGEEEIGESRTDVFTYVRPDRERYLLNDRGSRFQELLNGGRVFLPLPYHGSTRGKANEK